MQASQKILKNTFHANTVSQGISKKNLGKAIEEAWKTIAPFWPLKNLIAVNPLSGFEDLPFESALIKGDNLFRTTALPEKMHPINRLTIKWLQAFLDQGQATVSMPYRGCGLFQAIKQLIIYDKNLHEGCKSKIATIKSIPNKPLEAISYCLSALKISEPQIETFLEILLSTLPGWAGYIKYRCEWADVNDQMHPYPVTQEDYLALRLMITFIIWPEARAIFTWKKNIKKNNDGNNWLNQISDNEKAFRASLLSQLHNHKHRKENRLCKAQFVFCIDVRSEPFRRSLESVGSYETFGFAGFFGLPVRIKNDITGYDYASCPVLLKAQHTIKETPICSGFTPQKGQTRLTFIKKIFQSLKYTFTTPLALAEALGALSGIWMTVKTLLPKKAQKLKHWIKQKINPVAFIETDHNAIPFEQQCAYAENVLRMMGLTENFAPLVVFCGHGSETHNNAYATALDCGACGGHHGASNAKLLATILNQKNVRQFLHKKKIIIPASTYFVAAQHNTTTDAITFYTHAMPTSLKSKMAPIENDTKKAQKMNVRWRLKNLGHPETKNATQITACKAMDWAQIRPEWGLADNAGFIVGPRSLTKEIDLQGRCFLHSYDWKQDPDGTSLTTILTAPMVVAHWINSQYLFSTLDNVSYGSGSKITQNIVGKIGIMQGNASDLMHGLPLQSVNMTDQKSYHRPQRLLTIVSAPQKLINSIIDQQPTLQKLFGNGWVTLICMNPDNQKFYLLNRDYSWTPYVTNQQT